MKRADGFETGTEDERQKERMGRSEAVHRVWLGRGKV